MELAFHTCRRLSAGWSRGGVREEKLKRLGVKRCLDQMKSIFPGIEP